MELHEKIKFLRHRKGWSQEEIAHKLGISVNGYGNIERGETDIPLSRLRKIAEVFEINVAELFCSREGHVFNLACAQNNSHGQWNIGAESPESKQEIDRLRWNNAQKESEISFLKTEISYLKQIIALYEKTSNS